MNEQWASDTGLPFIADPDEWTYLVYVYGCDFAWYRPLPSMIEAALTWYGLPVAMRWLCVDAQDIVLGVIPRTQ